MSIANWNREPLYRIRSSFDCVNAAASEIDAHLWFSCLLVVFPKPCSVHPSHCVRSAAAIVLASRSAALSCPPNQLLELQLTLASLNAERTEYTARL
jgi:hypothetical protein